MENGNKQQSRWLRVRGRGGRRPELIDVLPRAFTCIRTRRGVERGTCRRIRHRLKTAINRLNGAFHSRSSLRVIYPIFSFVRLFSSPLPSASVKKSRLRALRREDTSAERLERQQVVRSHQPPHDRRQKHTMPRRSAVFSGSVKRIVTIECLDSAKPVNCGKKIVSAASHTPRDCRANVHRRNCLNLLYSLGRRSIDSRCVHAVAGERETAQKT